MAKKNLSLIKEDTVDVVAAKVDEFRRKGELDLPNNYSAANAMKSAWLKLQETYDKAKNPVMEVCTTESIMNSLLDMVVQGLNPAKEQCYFIAYGKSLVCHRSYFGDIALVKRVAGAKDVVAQVVRKGDEFEFEIVGGRPKITKHKQTLESLNNEMVAAYAIIEFEDDRPDYTVIMTIEEIVQAWKQGPNYKDNGNGTHQKFDQEMAKKTVAHRAAKPYINASHDDALLSYHIGRSEEERAKREVQREIDENANSEVIDIEPEPEQDTEEHEELEREPANGDQGQESQKESDSEPKPQETATQAPEQQKFATAEGPDF